MKHFAERLTKLSHAHLQEAEESYSTHLRFTVHLGAYIFLTALILLLHGLIPGIFTRTASMRIERMYLMLKSRIKKDRREVIEADWEI